MARPVFWHHLDAAVARGWQTPHCPYDHGREIVLPPWCHPGVSVRIEPLDTWQGIPGAAVVGLRCWRCQRSAVQMALTRRLARTPACRHGSALEVWYRAGTLTVSYRRCHAVQGTVAVAPYEPV
jgi:hypothetical protein